MQSIEYMLIIMEISNQLKSLNNSYNIAKECLNNAYIKYSPTSLMGIIMNPNTGEILAMASYPDYEPGLFYNGISTQKYKEYNKRSESFISSSISSFSSKTSSTSGSSEFSKISGNPEISSSFDSSCFLGSGGSSSREEILSAVSPALSA